MNSCSLPFHNYHLLRPITPSIATVAVRLFRHVQPPYNAFSYIRESVTVNPVRPLCHSQPPVSDASPQTLHAFLLRTPSSSCPLIASFQSNSLKSMSNPCSKPSISANNAALRQGFKSHTMLMCTISLSLSCCGSIRSMFWRT